MGQREGLRRLLWVCYAVGAVAVILSYRPKPERPHTEATRAIPEAPAGKIAVEDAGQSDAMNDFLLALVLEKAQEGDPAAIRTVAAWYETHDPEQAIVWYGKVIETRPDDPGPMILLAKIHEARKEYLEAVGLLRRAAELGSADAQYDLGFFYMVGGNGIAKDKSQAVEWWRKAAAQGHVEARNRLAESYSDGRGVGKDGNEAVRQWRIAADRGNVSAMSSLGNAYFDGKGVTQDKAEGARWYRMAADRGDKISQVVLGIVYRDGNGVEKNPVEAAKWFRKAVEQGDHMARYGLAVMLYDGDGIPPDPTEAVRLWRMDGGWDDTTRYRLGTAYAEGRGVERNMAEAVRWWRPAAEAGVGPAQEKLGDAYAAGEGVEKDMEQAIRWWREAGHRFGGASAVAKLRAIGVEP